MRATIASTAEERTRTEIELARMEETCVREVREVEERLRLVLEEAEAYLGQANQLIEAHGVVEDGLRNELEDTLQCADVLRARGIPAQAQ